MSTIYQNLFDSHNHSLNSEDGNHSVTFMAEQAILAGVQGFAVTDHCECNLLEETDAHNRMRQTAAEVARAREAFYNRIIISTGIELGQPGFAFQAAEQIVAAQAYDVVLLSLHRIQNYDDFYNLDYSLIAPEELDRMILQYFEELAGLVQWGHFDVVAHMTFPVRYPMLYNGIHVDIRRYAEPIDTVLRLMAQNGKALEINTSGLRSVVGDTMAPAWVVRRFRELGGEFVTIGSDAHFAQDIGKGVQQGMEIMAEAGFTRFAWFRDRKPVMLSII